MSEKHSRGSVWLSFIGHQYYHLEAKTRSPDWEEVPSQVCLTALFREIDQFISSPLLPSERKRCLHQRILNVRWKLRPQESTTHSPRQTP